MKNLTLGSLFDGSGGFPLGGLLSGITPVWASEIEPFPIRVTTKRLPFMKHYGDISQMDGSLIEPVDIITFGSPCTDMSVAGKRAGLDGKQSVLFYEAIRIIREMRCATNGKYPRWICWENVPGAFSSNSGRDFQAVLEAVIDIVEPGTSVPFPEKGKWPHADCYMGDRWSVAYRTLDAQHWGVPQRRKRIYLVADFADRRGATEVLFKSEGLSRYSAESFRAWQGTAAGVENCLGATGFDGYNASLTGDVSSTIGVNCGMSTGRNGIVLNDQGGQRMDVTDEVTATLRAKANHPPCVLEAAGFCTEHSSQSRSIGYEDETSPTLRAGTVPAAVALENHPADSRVKVSADNKVQALTSRMGTGGGNVPLVMKIRCGCEGGGKGPLIQTNKSVTLSCNNDQTLFEPKAYGICSKDSNAMKSDNPQSGFYEATTSRTIDGNGGNPSCNQGGIAVVESYAIQGSMIGRDDKNGPQGDGINEDVSFTLNTVDRHAVYAMTTGSFTQVSENTAPTVLARDYKDPTTVCYGIGRDAFNQGKNAKFSPTVIEELQPTLVAKGPGGVAQVDEPQTASEKSVVGTISASMGSKQWLGNQEAFSGDYHIVYPNYTVRRLTPTECARLQGFPDWWCSDLGTDDPSDEDIRYWQAVFETHRKITGSSTKPKTVNQIVKWLKDPHSDAAEYKLWGNGVCLSNVWFVLAGIAYYTQSQS